MRNSIFRKACFLISTACIIFFIDCFSHSYSFVKEPIDVIIPAIEKDLVTLEFCIEGVKKHCPEVRRIIVISNKRLTHQAEWFDEKSYPFNKKEIIRLLKSKAPNKQPLIESRSGWYLQQLLKFYSLTTIPGISSNVLMVDADTVFLRKMSFMNEEGAGFLTPSQEYHPPYFEHASKLVPGFFRATTHSGVAHHMLFQKPLVDHLFSLVEQKHQRPLWQAFCLMVNPNSMFAGASEYEIYFHFALSQTDQIKIRPLKWANISYVNEIPKYAEQGYDYVSCHTWMRKK